MVVDLREAEIFVGQVAQLVEGGLNTEAAGRYGLQQEPELLVDGEYPAICGRIIASANGRVGLDRLC